MNAVGKRSKKDAEEEEAELASSSEDEFYDRTEEGRRKKRGKEGNAALDAASLYGKKVSGACLCVPLAGRVLCSWMIIV